MTDEASAHTSSASRILIKALEDVILPIISAHVPELAMTDSVFRDDNDTHLEPEAHQLVSALEKFIAALLHPQKAQRSTIESEQAVEISGDVPETVTAPVSDANPSITRVYQQQISSTQSAFLEEALKQAHHRVFNKMPIRLLAFKSDGSGIELVERSTVYGRIASAMKSDIHKANTDNVKEFISRHTKYAILSHTWLRDLPEVTYAAWKAADFEHGSVGYQKLVNFCRTAAMDHDITFGWMDTVCINKDSSTELDESIRSMYAWYTGASICITYLAETKTLQHMHKDSWFTRGWTLQELLAPQSIEFYGENWQTLPRDLDTDGRCYRMEYEILEATGISQDDRQLFRKNRRRIPISKKMMWAGNRQVTREEDMAYSLMGIFDVSLSIAYGEGSERAFIRLLKEVMTLAGVSTLDILNCGNGTEFLDTSKAISSLLPFSPKQYLGRSDLVIHWPTPSIPVTLTHLGLHVSILLMPAVSAIDTVWHSIGEVYADVEVELLGRKPFYDKNRVLPVPTRYNVLDKANPSCESSIGWRQRDGRFYILFGVLNFVDRGDSVFLPSCQYSGSNVMLSHGFALCFIMVSGRLERISTSRPVMLDIKFRSSTLHRPLPILKSKLGEFGIELRTTYL